MAAKLVLLPIVLAPALRMTGSTAALDAKIRVLRRGGSPSGQILINRLQISNPVLPGQELENAGDIILGYGGGRVRVEKMGIKMAQGQLSVQGFVEPGDEDGRVLPIHCLKDYIVVEFLHLFGVDEHYGLGVKTPLGNRLV